MSEAKLVCVPWSDEQVESLNHYQECGWLHPFTQDGVTLVATNSGWVTEKLGPVVQDWAYDFMVNGQWKSICKVRNEVLMIKAENPGGCGLCYAKKRLSERPDPLTQLHKK